MNCEHLKLTLVSDLSGHRVVVVHLAEDSEHGEHVVLALALAQRLRKGLAVLGVEVDEMCFQRVGRLDKKAYCDIEFGL